MYIHRLYSWDDDDWLSFYKEFGFSEEDGLKIRQILTLSTKCGIESHFKELKELGVINGIGPGYLMRQTRKFISYAFRGVKYEWHDIMYAIGGRESNRLSADYGLLKYSVISIRSFINDAKKAYNPFSMLFIYIASLLQFTLAFFCYLSVVAFGRFGSFRYVTKI